MLAKTVFIFAMVWLLAVPLVPVRAAGTDIFPIQPGVAIKSGYPAEYVVRRKDGLRDVTKVFFENPWEVEDTWQQRKPEISRGDVVTLVKQGDQMVLRIKHERTVRLSPGVRLDREERPIPIIPVSIIRQFLVRPVVVAENELKTAPYIFAATSPRLLLSTDDTIYARGFVGEPDEETFLIVRAGQAYRNRNSKEILAYEAVHLGEAQLERRGDPVTLRITSFREEITAGDRLLPLGTRAFERNFKPHPSEPIENGEIIGVVDGVSQIGQYQIVVSNKGLENGIEIGHTLGIYRGGRQVWDKVSGTQVHLPATQIGKILVFRVFDRVNYGLVMKATHPIHVYDKIDAPE
ncbi:MAG: peptidoglycan-binding protein [Gammaproteobacteria bacterium]|nr:peptidoglycan-binding protein [Gammaproteobacteria bacterium]